MSRRHWIIGLSLGLLSFAAPKLHAEGTPRRILATDGSTHHIAIFEVDANGGTGKILWQRNVGDCHDLHMLPNGHVLFEDGFTHLLEVIPGMNGQPDQTVWEYDASKMNGNAGRPVEVHAFQRLANGITMISEGGPARIIEVDADGKIVHQIALHVEHPSPHSDTRLVRKLDNGHYLVCHELDGAVREYDADGKVVWDYPVPLFGRQPGGGHGPEGFGNRCFCPMRLPNGNTLISAGNGHSILEVTPDKQIVWSVTQNELPGIQLAWVTTLQKLDNGNLVFGNCHAPAPNPQIIEITPDKKVVWTYKDFQLFGGALSNSTIVEDGGKAIFQ